MDLRSFPSNDSYSSDASFPLNIKCFIFPPTSFVFVHFNMINIVILLPLCIFILYHGLRQRRKTWGHSDVFTFHMVLMEFLRVCGCFCCILGVFLRLPHTLLLHGTKVLFFTWYGQTFIHVLTVVERYLAVVHPITYRGLKNQRGTRIRNVSIVCVWLSCLIQTVLKTFLEQTIWVDLVMFLLVLVLVFFCSAAVLRVLTRLSPGEQGGSRERVDHSKQRAFYTIVAILGVLVLRFTGNLTWALLHVLDYPGYCVFVVIGMWFDFLSSLVLPLLFLHKEGKLSLKIKRNIG